MFTIALSTDATSDAIEASTDQDLDLPLHLVTATESSEHEAICYLGGEVVEVWGYSLLTG